MTARGGAAARWPCERSPFPVRALMDRLGPRPQLCSWSGHLPPSLATKKPMITAAAPALAVSQAAHSDADDHSHAGHVDDPVSRQLTEASSCSVEGGLEISGSSLSVCSTAPSDFELEATRPSSECMVRGRVWFLAQDPKGCRLVQEALDLAASEEVRVALAYELKGHVAHALRCPHANHVLQKCIAGMKSESLQFIVEEVTARSGLVAQATRHRYGCRIVQQLIKKCQPQQVHALAEVLLADATAFSCHPFGNYVMQHLAEHGTEDQRHRLIRAIERNVATIARSTSGCGVLSAAIKHGAKEDTVWLARAVLQESGLLRVLAHARHGNDAVLILLRTLEGNERDYATSDLFGDIIALRGSRYGRSVAEHLEPDSAPAVDVAGHHSAVLPP